jgi:hypothetical protein
LRLGTHRTNQLIFLRLFFFLLLYRILRFNIFVIHFVSLTSLRNVGEIVAVLGRFLFTANRIATTFDKAWNKATEEQ